jgi:SecA DEAD-like domain
VHNLCYTFVFFFFVKEAFAVVREASKRVLGLRPFDVQLIGTYLSLTVVHFPDLN